MEMYHLREFAIWQSMSLCLLAIRELPTSDRSMTSTARTVLHSQDRQSRPEHATARTQNRAFTSRIFA